MDAGSLPVQRQIGLWTNLRRCQTQERIFRGDYDQTDYEGIYGLYLEAYGDEELAIQAENRARRRLMRQETEAARLARSSGMTGG